MMVIAILLRTPGVYHNKPEQIIILNKREYLVPGTNLTLSLVK